ncbi:unnamed protein product, partial [Phaeothamnion confervicola]
SGTLFETTRDTLTRDPHTYFAATLRLQPPETAAAANTARGGDGMEKLEFFVDRDPTHFRHILNYLRDSYIYLDSRGTADLHFLEELLQEAQFYNVSGLCEDVARRIHDISRRQKEEPSGDKDFRLVTCTVGTIQEVFHEWVIGKNYECESMQIAGDTAFFVLGRRVSRGELALVERLMKT